jgi:flavin reductase (DIM6/NTAB) family NADH-FMN oxidoreductase RutF
MRRPGGRYQHVSAKSTPVKYCIDNSCICNYYCECANDTSSANEVSAMSEPADDLRAQFRAAMRRHPAAVTIVTAADERRHHGMTATAVTSLSLEPPSLLVCVNRTALLHDILVSARRFCVNLLGSDQAHLSGAFGGSVPPAKRFELGTWLRTAEGIDFLADAQANIFCRCVAVVPYGTHAIFIGEVEWVRLSSPVAPLIYHDATYCTSIPAVAAA